MGRAGRPTLDLAPGGVYQAARVTPDAGALLPHRCTLACGDPRNRGSPIGGLLSVALSFESPRLAVSQHPALRSPDLPRPGHARPRPPDRLTVATSLPDSMLSRRAPDVGPRRQASRESPAVCWRSVARRGHHGQREPGTGHPCGRPHLPPAFPAAPNRRWPPPTLPPGANPTPRPAAVAGPRRDLLHPAAPDQAGTGRGRHQAVPVSRPVPPDHRRGVDVGPQHRAGHGDPPEHRLPVPDGPVLHLRPLAGYPRTGSASASGWAPSCWPPVWESLIAAGASV